MFYFLLTRLTRFKLSIWLCTFHSLSIHSVNLSDPHLAPLRLSYSTCLSFLGAKNRHRRPQSVCRRNLMEFNPAVEFFGAHFRVSCLVQAAEALTECKKGLNRAPRMFVESATVKNPSGCAPVRPTNVFKTMKPRPKSLRKKMRLCINNVFKPSRIICW